MISARPAADDFYAHVPVFDGFDRIMEPALYRPLPDDWVLALTDVVGSTKAIAAGRYKAVNMAGAAVIAAVQNALGRRELPFVFGGDGASLAVPPADAAATRAALAATATWVAEEIGLGLRVAMLPMAAVRAAGRDVRVARFAVSPFASYAMFSGGGLAWAERQLKAGAFAVPPAPPGTRPDLTGLSCRWEQVPAEGGVLLSLLVAPTEAADPAVYRALIEDVLALAPGAPEAGRPLPTARPAQRWPPRGLELEARASHRPGTPLWRRRLALAMETLLAWVVFKTGAKVGGFDPALYWHDLVENADFRKYDDALRMTLDCTPELAERIEARLRRAQAEGVARYGVHRQRAALITCIVPSFMDRDHIHFVDGASGGYAAAAAGLKDAGG